MNAMIECATEQTEQLQKQIEALRNAALTSERVRDETEIYFASDRFKRLTQKVLRLFTDLEGSEVHQIALFHSQLIELQTEIINDIIRLNELPKGIDELNGFLWALITAMHPAEGHTTKEAAVMAGLTRLYDLDGDLFSSASYGRMRNNYLLSTKMLSDYHTYDIIDFTTRLFYSFM